ncbi:centrosome-associated protein CEP250-like [Mytilus trossulus]|uniref:centrosome-associated protein CEP250-like n=1 Tax=Mytilus trossulus TaxID=6551 RepID=UPI0030077173
MSGSYKPGSAAGVHKPPANKKNKAPTTPIPVQSTNDPQRNDQEEIWECICSLGKKIRKDFKKSGKVQTSVREIEKYIQNLIDNVVIEEKEQHDTKGAAISKDKPKESNKYKKDTTQAAKEKEGDIDLSTLFKKMTEDKMKLNKDLMFARKDLNTICEKISATGKDLGIEIVDGQPNDGNSSTKTITSVLEENKKLSKILSKLIRGIETFDMQQKDSSKDQHKKNAKGKQEEKDKKKSKSSKQSDKQHSDLSDETPFTVFTAFGNHASRVTEILKNESMLQEQKSQLDKIKDIALRLCNQEDQQNQTVISLKETDKAVDIIQKEVEKLLQMKEQIEKEKMNLEYCLTKAEVVSQNIKTSTKKPRDSGKITANTTSSNVKTTGKKIKLTDKTQQSNDDKKIKAEERTNTPDKAHEYISETVKKLEQILNYIEDEFNKLDHQERKKDKMLNHVLNTTQTATSHVKNSIENMEMEGKKLNVEDFDDLSSFNEDILNLVTNLESLKKTYHKNLQEISQTKKQLEEAKHECETLQHRLSKMAGARLTDGNPNITNLGDPNRPMKIGETYSELYDNEWTDTMDLCIQKFGKSYSEDTIIQNLFKTIVGCHKFCEEKSAVMLIAGKESLQTAVKTLMIVSSEAEVVKQAMDMRKMAAESTSDQLLDSICKGKKEIIAPYFKTMEKKILELIMSTSFFTKCFKLCWKMVVQDPPMFLDEGPQKDKAFDKNVFREYTNSGTKVVFTVWPALYLHKNGALLVKGVVKVK